MNDNQHYVPQFLLRPFGEGRKKSRTIWMLDKQSGTVTKEFIKEVACGDRFYDLFSAKSKSLDPLMGELETQAAPTFRRLVEGRSIRLLGGDARRTMAFFLAVQMLRTPNKFYDHERKTAVTRQILSKMNATEELLAQFPTGTALRDQYILLIAKLAPQMVDAFLDLRWITATGSSSPSLYISDNPIVMHNHLPSKPFRSNNGLACEGICVYVLLSPRRIAQLICKKTLANLCLHDIRFALSTATDKDLALTKDNIIFANSLQVINAERYLFSASPDFSLAIDMLNSNPALRNGPRSSVIHPHGDEYPEEDLEVGRQIKAKSRDAERRRHLGPAQYKKWKSKGQ